MSSTIAALTSGAGGISMTGDASGILNLNSNGTNVASVSSTGMAVTGTLSASGASTFTGTGKFATTIGVGNATPAASGSGITFPATQSPSSDANTLDDYEEGTFTPVLNFGGASVGIVYDFQQGRYTKVGNVVTVQIYIDLSSKGTSVGHAGVSGLPFTSATTVGSQMYAAQGDTLNMFLVYLPALSAAPLFYTAATTAAITNTSFTGGDNLRITIIYLV